MFDLGAAKWWAIELMHVRDDRQPALISKTTTEMEEVAKDPAFHGALIFRTHHRRRVLLLMGMSDHELWHRITNSRKHLPHKDPGNQLHLHDIAEARDGNVYAPRADIAAMRFELGSRDVLGFELVRCTHDGQKPVVEDLERLFKRDESTPDTGFLAALIAASDDGTRVAAFSRWEQRERYAGFLGTDEARRVLQPLPSEATSEEVDPIRLTIVVEPGGAKAHDPAYQMS